MQTKLKPRKCRKCKAEFEPKVEWQKYCGTRCSARVKNEKKAKLFRELRKAHEAQQRGAA